MVDIDKAIIARLKIQGENFEILVDCDNALLFKEGKASLDDAIVTEEVFKDVKKGLYASEHEMQKIFGTSDKKKVAEIIIKKGEVQLTAEHQNKLREEKRKRIINLIHRNAIDPKTNLPHPPQRIENALVEAKINIDHFKSAESQVKDIIKKLTPILPIRFEIREVAIKIPANYAARSYSLLKQYAKITKDEWQDDGSLIAVIEIPAGMQQELFDELNKLTHGDIESKILKSI